MVFGFIPLWLICLIVYVVLIFIYSCWLYNACLKYYKPLYYQKDPNSPKEDVHKMYHEFQCQDSISFLRIFFGSLLFFVFKLSTLIFIVIVLNIQLKYINSLTSIEMRGNISLM